MARNSDIVRSGQAALPDPEHTPQGDQPADQAASQPQAGAGGVFSSLPHVQQPPPTQMQDFPVLSQIYNEVGTIATVVDQINQITDFIQTFAAVGGTTPPQPTAPPPQTQPAPTAQAPVQPLAPAPTAQPAPPVPAPAAPTQPQPTAPAPEPTRQLPEEEIEALYEELYTLVESVMQAAQEGRPLNIDQAFVYVPQIVDTPGATDILYRRAIYARETEDDHGFASIVVLHSVNVAIYALKIGEGLDYNRDQLIDLGVAALVHDVGMVTLPPELFTKGQYTQQDIDILHQHPSKARDILGQLGQTYVWLTDVVYQEHEREDGSGYPQGLPGDQVHEYAKIVGVADVYAGYTRSRPERHGLLPFEAVKEILQSRKQEFDPRVIRILLRTLSAFPIGSLVKLNSGAVGRVVDTDVDSPLRPVIEILYDPEGRPLQETREIRLREQPILHITDTVDPEDV